MSKLHRIRVFSIEKEIKDEFETISQNYIKMISRYAKFEHNICFNKKIANAQKKDKVLAKKSYSEAYSDKANRYSICLDESGKVYDSIKFSEIFKQEDEINFFIGGAYGFENSFLKQCDEVISLSRLTFSHKIAKIVLFEQIYRALSIVNNHPYHK
jgi:23S rRNA (pseudouridine1915-N3)-methyltransferase